MEPGSIVKWPLFILLTLVHVYANYRCVSALRLRTLNRQRGARLIAAYHVATMKGKNPERNVSPAAIAASETLLWTWRPSESPGLDFARGARFGVKVADTLLGDASRHPEQPLCAELAVWIRGAFAKERYLLAPPRRQGNLLGPPCVLLAISSSSVDVFRALMHIVVLGELIASYSTPHNSSCEAVWRAAVGASLDFTRAHFGRLCHLLEKEGWETQHLLISLGQWRCEWDAPPPAKDE